MKLNFSIHYMSLQPKPSPSLMGFNSPYSCAPLESFSILGGGCCLGDFKFSFPRPASSHCLYGPGERIEQEMLMAEIVLRNPRFQVQPVKTLVIVWLWALLPFEMESRWERVSAEKDEILERKLFRTLSNVLSLENLPLSISFSLSARFLR